MRSDVIVRALAVAAILGTAAPGGAQQTPVTDPYARYATPDECLSAGARTEGQFWRARRPDTLSVAPVTRPRQRSAVDAVRRCLAHFDPARIAEREQLGLGAAYLGAEEPARADSVFRRYAMLLAPRPLRERAWGLYQIVESYLDAHPIVLARVDEYVAQLDALGPAAAAERLLAHVAVGERAAVMDSLPYLDTHAHAALRMSDSLVGDEKKEWAFSTADAYILAGVLAGRRDDGAGALATLQRGARILGPIRSDAVYPIAAVAPPYKLYGKPGAPVQASHWFGADSAGPIAPLTRPTPGRVMLLYFASNHCGDSCYWGYATLRRLAARYGTRGLDVVLASRTSGYSQNVLISNPISEASVLRQYMFDVATLPGSLAVWTTTFGTKSDGRKQVLSAPNEQAYRAGMGYAVLVDTHGVVRLISRIGPQTELQFDHAITAILSPE